MSDYDKYSEKKMRELKLPFRTQKRPILLALCFEVSFKRKVVGIYDII